MSFIQHNNTNPTYAPGYFLAHEECTRVTQTIPASLGVDADNGTKYVKMGTIFPANDATATGIVYEDVDVTTGDMPGSVVTAGTVYTSRLHTAPAEAAKTALAALGIKFVDAEPTVTRPY